MLMYLTDLYPHCENLDDDVLAGVILLWGNNSVLGLGVWLLLGQ